MSRITNAVAAVASTVALMTGAVAVADVSGPKISILGDSYSTFSGQPGCQNAYYPRSGNDVTSVEKTWWHQVIVALDGEFVADVAYGGSGFFKITRTAASGTALGFGVRAENIGDADIIIIFGGMNDDWGVGRGDIRIADVSNGVTKVFNFVKGNHPNADVYVPVHVLNPISGKQGGCPGLTAQTRQILFDAAERFGFTAIDLEDGGVTLNEMKTAGIDHPNAAIMTRFATTIAAAIKAHREAVPPESAECDLLSTSDSSCAMVCADGRCRATFSRPGTYTITPKCDLRVASAVLTGGAGATGWNATAAGTEPETAKRWPTDLTLLKDVPYTVTIGAGGSVTYSGTWASTDKSVWTDGGAGCATSVDWGEKLTVSAGGGAGGAADKTASVGYAGLPGAPGSLELDLVQPGKAPIANFEATSQDAGKLLLSANLVYAGEDAASVNASFGVRLASEGPGETVPLSAIAEAWTVGSTWNFENADVEPGEEYFVRLHLSNDKGVESDLVQRVVVATPAPGQRKLPDGYTRLLAVVSTDSNCCIDTEIEPSNDLCIDMRFEIASGSQVAYFGTKWGNDSQMVIMRDGHLRYYGKNYDLGGLLPATPADLSVRSGCCVVSQGKTSTSYNYDTTFSQSGNLCIFSCNDKTHGAAYRLYSFKLTRGNGEELRDFIPVRTALGEVGLYDFVSGTFFRNIGTGVLEGVSADFLAEVDDKVYHIVDGVLPEPLPRVYDLFDQGLLTLGVDYEVGYSGNDRTGTATLTVRGIGKYEGVTKVCTFAVVSVATQVVKGPAKNYTAVDWIESSGTQAIDTGIRYAANTRLEQRFYMASWPTANQTFGAVDYAPVGSTEVDRFHGAIMSADRTIRIYDLHGNSSSVVSTLFMTWQDLVIDTQSLAGKYLSGEAEHSTIWLFGRNSLSPNLQQYATYRLAQARVMKDGKVVRNLIPCRRNSDSALGMYDLVSRQFLTNVCSGVFTASTADALGFPEIPPQETDGTTPVRPHPVVRQGNVIREEGRDYTLTWTGSWEAGTCEVTISGAGDFAGCQPIWVRYDVISLAAASIKGGYQRVAWLESTPDGKQVLDTLVHPKRGTELRLMVMFPDLSKAGNIGMIDQHDTVYERFHFGMNGADLMFGMGNAPGDASCKLQSGVYAVIALEYDDAKGVCRVRHGATAVETSMPDVTFHDDNSTFWLFGRNSNVERLKAYSAHRLMAAEIRENGVLVHQFIPCRRTRDNALGMFDVIARKFHANTGSGEFVAGPEIPRPQTGMMLLLR